jgi:ATP-binding cassette subfamily B protein
LIGVGDVRTPYWAEIQQAAASAGLGTVIAAAGRVTVFVARRAMAASPRLTVLAVTLHVVSGVATTIGLFATANVFTALLQQGPSLARVVAAAPALAVVVATYAVRGLLDTAVGATQALLVPRVEQEARDRLNDAVLGVELAAFEDADFVELLGKASHDSLSQLKSVTGELLELLQAAISVVASMVVAGVFHPLLAPVVLLAAVPQGWAAIRTAQLSYASFVGLTSQNRRLSVTNDLMTSRRSAAEVRAFTAKAALLAEHRRLAAEVAAEGRALDLRKAFIRLGGRALAAVGTGIGFGMLGVLLYLGALPLALAGAAAVAMRTAASSVTTAVFTANRVYEAGLYIEMYVVCLADAVTRTRQPTARTAEIGPRVVELRQVSFAYPGSERPALSDVSVTLRAGQVVAVVGENGSGKSTLAKVATGLYLPTAGTVSWDGIDIAVIDPDVLFDRIAVIMQSPLEWPMTAANNIRIGRLDRPDAEQRRLQAAAKQAGAHELITRLPAGYDTVLSTRFQNGTDLSGGQWQRVGVARGIYRDAGFLVADEPSAALDARTEHEVFRTLLGTNASGHPARITLLITHRLANVRHADLIIVLAHGRIVETGSHGELMAAEGLYHELFSLQAAQYLDGIRSPE